MYVIQNFHSSIIFVLCNPIYMEILFLYYECFDISKIDIGKYDIFLYIKTYQIVGVWYYNNCEKYFVDK